MSSLSSVSSQPAVSEGSAGSRFHKPSVRELKVSLALPSIVEGMGTSEGPSRVLTICILVQTVFRAEIKSCLTALALTVSAL